MADSIIVRLSLALLCVVGLCGGPLHLTFAAANAASQEDSIPEIWYVRGCREAESVDARETTGCFAVTAGKGQASLPKSVLLSLQGIHLPTDLRNYRVLLQEYRRPSLLGEVPATAEAHDPAPVLLLCERPTPSELFPTQLLTCELVNPFLTMNSSDVWRPQLKRLADKPMWFDVRLQVKQNDVDAYRSVSVLRRAVLLQVTNVSHAGNESGQEMLQRQRRAVSWEEVRQHPLERLYTPKAVSAANTSKAPKTSTSQNDGDGDDDVFEDSDKMQKGEEVWVELGIGGLKRELRSLFRRVFLSRLPSLAPLADALQLQHVRGVILYGPPGNGKTLIARNLFRLLGPNTRLSVVNAADILSKFVGESEKNLRDVFEGYDIGTSSKAEDVGRDDETVGHSAHEDKDKDVAPGSLQVLVIDEFEALFRRRGHSGDESSAKAVYDGVTTTLLSLMDGVKSRNDLLVVGLTNRLQAIDQALLRPGRFEVLIEIPAPDVPGREDIFFIHTDRLREHNFLAADVELRTLALESGGFSGSDIAGTVRSAVSYALLRYRSEGLFAQEGTLHAGNDTSAQTTATAAAAQEATAAHVEEYGHRPGDIGGIGGGFRPLEREDGEGGDPDRSSSSGSAPPLFQVTRADFDKAMKDIRSAKDEASALSQLSTDGDGAGTDVIDYDGTVSRNVERARAAITRVMQSGRTMTAMVAVTGASGTGKSTMAHSLTRVHDFTTVRYFSCRRLAELRDPSEQLAKLRDALGEASHTERGLVVLDDYDVLVDSMGSSSGYAAMTLRGLLYEYMHRPGGVSRALIADSPLAAAEEAGGETEGGSVVVNAGSRVAAERNRRVLVLTSSLPSVLQQLSFDVHLRAHSVLRRGAATLLEQYRVVDAAHASAAASAYPVSMSYRTFLRVTDMALRLWMTQQEVANATGETQNDDVSGKGAAATGAGLELPAYFATSKSMRRTYIKLHAVQMLSDFYTVTTDKQNHDFVAAVRATVANMGLMDPYEGWKGEGSEEDEEESGEDDAMGDAEESFDIDAVVGAADEVLW
ncbi:putative mitochondrial vesicular-fusion ATPase-like protein [Leptomonas pyrrhocoris]|uniref:Putative mitochondrial vesicular-fusion ATPase-like protein n=1 Tax=Leptomonas pyrrhocoris TaxID=157538 RepID=A0A0M9G2P5_LEPPY|nr:putative mitochondrial vesicular-fusion ATPase-like protein [Leptomonas pyrrhocoris]KPA80926.1 putative mitochondrial vesicular-fusion ATPase-like protein [Leptomonas pyrrhocoris]|eukprot:XP_015659365.1 putative mitochondrial vesicular-fusion ATPase-like protein [Leptomonas pyrrhocoris]